MALPQYVPKANLFKLSSELLSNMEPPLNMEMDRFNSSKNLNYNPDIPESRENPKLIYNTDWIITEQNGALVTGAALQTIKNNLLTNFTLDNIANTAVPGQITLNNYGPGS